MFYTSYLSCLYILYKVKFYVTQFCLTFRRDNKKAVTKNESHSPIPLRATDGYINATAICKSD